MSPRIVAGTVLIVALTFLSMCGYGLHQRNLRRAAEAKVLEVSVELAGAHKALEAKPKEVVKFVEVPVPIKEAVKKGTLTPILAAKGTAKSETFVVPTCPEPVSVSDVTDAPTETPVEPAWVVLHGDIFVGKIKFGAPIWTATLGGGYHQGDYHTNIVFKPENINLDMRVSEEIGRAVEEYEKPWIKKHTALMCPGVGVTYNPLDSTSPVNVGVQCAYGFVWF